MLKRVILLVIAFMMSWSLIGCGGEPAATEAPASQEDQSAQTESAVVEDQAEETTAEPEATEATEETDEEVEVVETETEEPAVAEETIEEVPVEVREPTTVQAAMDVIDLRTLPLPTEIRGMGQQEPGNFSLELPGTDVEGAVALFQSAFIEQGWENDTANEYTSADSANRYFFKDNFAVSFSVSNFGDFLSLSFINHGNLDLRTLPQMADAELLYNFPNTLGYVSPSAVGDVAEFTRQELAAQGWHKFTLPNTASSDDPDSQHLMFIQNGLELSASVGVAPGQDNQTAVQYTINLLPLDIPIYENPMNLEFDKHFSELTYTSEADIDTLVAFYGDSFANLGWAEMTNADDLFEGMTGATFSHPTEDVTLILIVLSEDGEQVVSIGSGPDVELLATTDSEEDTTETSDVVGMDSDLAATNLPVASDAVDLNIDTLSEQISYASLSDVESLVEFYQQEMVAQGWEADEDLSFIEENFASLDFVQGDEARLTVDIFNDGFNDETTVDMYGYGLVWGDATVGSGDLPQASNLPVAPDAENVDINNANEEIVYNSPSDIETLVEFYQSEMTAQGWEVDETFTFVEESIASLEFIQGDSSVTVSLFDFDTGETEVLVYGYGLTWGDVSNEEIADSFGFPSASELPISPDAELIDFDNVIEEISYASTSDVETLAAFYQQEMSSLGWAADEDLSFMDDSLASLDFTKDDASVTINMVADGTGTTDVVIYGYGLMWDTGSATGAEASESGELTLIEEEGFLVPSDNTGFFSSNSDYSETINVYTTLDFETIIELYDQNLPNYGSELYIYDVDEESAAFDIIGTDETLFATMQIFEGETELMIARRDEAAAAADGILPTSGQGRFYLGNILEEGDITVSIEGQTVTVPPSNPNAESPDEFEYVELPPGLFTMTLTLPDGSEVSDEIRVWPDSVSVVILDIDGPWPLLIY